MTGETGDVRRVVEGDRRHVPAHVSDVVRPATHPLALVHRTSEPRPAREPAVWDAELALNAFREHLILFIPGRDPDRLDVLVHRFGDRAMEVAAPSRADHHHAIELRAGH